jgi:hypothetical protein
MSVRYGDNKFYEPEESYERVNRFKGERKLITRILEGLTWAQVKKHPPKRFILLDLEICETLK